MVNKQDSYWMEYTLDEKVDQKVCEYLRKHHAEYRNTKQGAKGTGSVTHYLEVVIYLTLTL